MKNWVLIYATCVLALPILYAINEGMDPSRPNPHNHEIQNLLTYLLLIRGVQRAV